jgi:hypothetical protein
MIFQSDAIKYYITTIISYSYYNVFKDGLSPNYLEKLLQFFTIYLFTDLYILLLLKHPYFRTLRTLIPLIPFRRSLGPCKLDSSDTPLGITGYPKGPHWFIALLFELLP